MICFLRTQRGFFGICVGCGVFFLTKSEWYDIMDVQTEIRRMISALHLKIL